MLDYERSLKKSGYTTIIGVDEAGRGPLAGPVVAGAVVLTRDAFVHRIDDSKKLSAQQRYAAFHEIIRTSSFGIGIVGQEIIDRVNILVASRIAMERAITALSAKLTTAPPLDKSAGFSVSTTHVLADGNMKLDTVYRCMSIIGGDAQSLSIAAASIIAKVVRDAIMVLYDREYPAYGFAQHKGYPTRAHRDAVKKFGMSSIHRRSFCIR